MKKIFEFWEDIEVPYRKFYRDWNHVFQKKLKNYLNKKDETVLSSLCEILSIDISQLGNSPRKEDLIEALLTNEHAIIVWCVKYFYEKKVLLIEQYLMENHLVVPKQYKNSPFSALLYLYFNNNAAFTDIYIKFYWAKLKERCVLYCYRPLTQAHADIISKKRVSICNYLRKQDKPYHYSQKIIGPFIEEGKAYFLYQSQTDYMQKKDIDRSRISKPFAKFPFCLDYENKSIEIHCQPGYFKNKIKIKKLINKINFHTKLIFHDEEEPIMTNFEFKPFLESLNKRKEDLNSESLKILKVVGIEFNKSVGLPYNYPITLPKNREWKDIRPVINSLIGREIINENNLQNNIKKFIIQYEKLRPREIEPIKESYTITYSLDKSHLDNEKIENIYNACLRLLHLPLDQQIDLSKIPEIRYNLIMSLLNDQELKPNSVESRELEQLESKRLLQLKSLLNYFCTNCKHKPQNDNRCENCGSSQIIPRKKGWIGINILRQGIIEYLTSLLEKENIKVLNKNAVRTLIDKYQFMEVEVKGKKAFLYLIIEPIAHKQLAYFDRSAMPILFVHVGHKHSEDLLKLKPHYLQRDLPSIYLLDQEKKLSDDFFTSPLIVTTNESESIIASRAETSANNIIEHYKGNINLDKSILEDDAYNLIKFITRNAEKWGKLMKTKEEKRMPEGIAGVHYTDKSRNYKGAFSYDCKFTESQNGYNLNIAEKRKAKEYIIKLKKQTIIRSFGNRLNSYIIVSNKIRNRQFHNFTKTVKKEAEWDGNMLLISPLNLAKLYSIINSRYSEILKDYNRYQKALYKLFCRKRKIKKYSDYYEITENEILKTFSYLGIDERTSIPDMRILKTPDEIKIKKLSNNA